MEKVSLDEIINAAELPLLANLDCPIDNMISLNPVMCKKCETVFCPDCIENWKKKSNACPMRCNPIELVPIDKSILKQHINRIKLACPFQKNGCFSQILINDLARHEKVCEFRPHPCEKCSGLVPILGIQNHLHESCPMNIINCLICNNSFNIQPLSNHLEECRINSVLCKVCLEIVSNDLSNTHNSQCPLRIAECPQCHLPDLNKEIRSGTHRCIDKYKLDDNNLNNYLKSLHSKYEQNMNEIILRKEKTFKSFNSNLCTLGTDLFKRENDKCLISEQKFNKISEEQSKRLMNIKKDKIDYLNKIKKEINEWNNMIENKNQEILNLENLCEKNTNLLKREYELKIQAKKRNLDYLRSLFIQGGKSNLLEDSHANPNYKPSISSKMSIVPCCRYCGKEVSESLNNKCGNCSTPICKSCSKQCPNKNFDHSNNYYCKECLAECFLCLETKQCKSCIKKCFYKQCPNILCNTCYDTNKHQLRSETNNCKFFKCDGCQTDANCIMTTVYCNHCDRRICRNCYINEHKIHMNKKRI